MSVTNTETVTSINGDLTEFGLISQNVSLRRFDTIRRLGAGRRSRPFELAEIRLERHQLRAHISYFNCFDDHTVELAGTAAALDQTAERSC